MKLPTALEEHLRANGVKVQDPETAWGSGGQGLGVEVAAPGVGVGGDEGNEGRQQASSRDSPMLSQPQHQGEGGQGPGHSQGQPPYSASFKEVMAMVQAGKVPPDVVKVDDSPIATPSWATAGAPQEDSPKPRAKPWERNFSGIKPPMTPHAPNGSVGGGDARLVPAAVAAPHDHGGFPLTSQAEGAPFAAMLASTTRVNSNLDVAADAAGPLAEGFGIRALPVAASPFEPGVGGMGLQLTDFAGQVPSGACANNEQEQPQ